MKTAAHKQEGPSLGRAFPFEAPLRRGGIYPPEAPAEGCGARETWGPGSASSPYGLLASTPHIAAAPLIKLLACGQAGGYRACLDSGRACH